MGRYKRKTRNKPMYFDIKFVSVCPYVVKSKNLTASMSKSKKKDHLLFALSTSIYGSNPPFPYKISEHATISVRHANRFCKIIYFIYTLT